MIPSEQALCDGGEKELSFNRKRPLASPRSGRATIPLDEGEGKTGSQMHTERSQTSTKDYS